MTRFAAGDAVVVRDDWPETRGPAHIRTPHYVRGRRGMVRSYLGRFANPEDLAFGRPAAPLDLYHVAFPPRSIWSEAVAGDEIVVELYDSWLEAA